MRGGASLHIGIGNRNIRVSDDGSAAGLGRALQQAFDEIRGDLITFCDSLEGSLPEDLAAALAPTLELSKKYCPKDTGALVGSAYLTMEKYRGGSRAEIGYGRGGDPEYAIYVHEVPATHAAPTSDKFLQRAIDEDYGNIVLRVAQRVKARIDGQAVAAPKVVAPQATGPSKAAETSTTAPRLGLRKFTWE